MSVAGDLSALFRIAYAKGIIDLVPSEGKIRELVPFISAERQNGLTYNQPVALTQEAGFTYSVDSPDLITLNDAIGMQMAQAVVPGYDLVLSSAVNYNTAARASHSATSFKQALGMKLENMTKSAIKRLDITMVAGQTPKGVTISQATATTDPLAVQLTTASWATGRWSGSEQSQICFVKASDNTAVDSLRSFTIARVDVDNRTLYVSAGTAGTPGSLATLETAIEAYACNVHYYGSVSGSAGTFAYSEQAGLIKQMTNSGSLFGISASTYDLWKGNSVTVSGQLTIGKVLSAVAKAVQRGLESDVVLFCNPNTWADMATNLAALRMYDSSYSKAKASNGSKELEYVGQNGMIKIMSYNIIAEGEALCFAPEDAIRVGANELSFQDPTKNGEIFFQLPTQNGVGFRMYSNEAIFLEKPAQTVYISGITNSGS